MVHLTPVAAAAVSRHGWRRLPSGVWVTALPLVDTSNEPRFAHLDYESLLAVAARLPGARIIAPARVVELNRYGHRLTPVTFAPSSSKETCDDHDDEVLSQLERWDETLPVANAGKPWVSGALAGKSRLFGWSTSATSSKMGPNDFSDWLQPLQNAHNRKHVDYSSLCTLEADEDLGGYLLGLVLGGVVGGALTGFAAASNDEIAASGEGLPHGYRCSVAELVADAKALGTWRSRDSGYRPRRGDLVISARAGGEPERGGSGHVELALEDAAVGSRIVDTLGGNESNTWITGPYDLTSKDYRGCIERGLLGARAVEVALLELARGVREVAGPAANPRIQLYHAGARRKGSPTAGMPGHETEGDNVLGKRASDEIPWCASSASFCTYEAARAA